MHHPSLTFFHLQAQFFHQQNSFLAYLAKLAHVTFGPCNLKSACVHVCVCGGGGGVDVCAGMCVGGEWMCVCACETKVHVRVSVRAVEKVHVCYVHTCNSFSACMFM